MRRHAKASSAGSDSGQGASFGSLHRPRTLAILVFALTVVAYLLPSSSLAAESRALVGSFGFDGTSGTEFERPRALAFDQGNKRLYAFDGFASTVYGFDTSTPGAYAPLGGEFPLTVPAGGPIPDLAVDSASHDLYYLSEENAFLAEPSLYAFDSAGHEITGNFPIGGFSDPCGAAVDLSGNVWVGDYGANAIKEYDSAGNPVKSFSLAVQREPCHVAFDSEENLYVASYEGPTWKYTAAEGYSGNPVDSEHAPERGGIAVDRSTDDLYVTHTDHVSVFSPTGVFLGEFGEDVSGAEFGGIAINQATEEVYVGDLANGKVDVFGPPFPLPDANTEAADAVSASGATLHASANPRGKQLSDCHFDFVPASQFASDEYGSVTPAEQVPCVPAAASIPVDSSSHAVSAAIGGLTANTTYHFRLVVANANGVVDGADAILTTALGPPVVISQSVEVVGTSDVTVSAKVNPKGAKTTYHVEYGPTASYGQSTPESTPIGFGSDDSDHAVSIHIGGLEPGTAYHFHFVATSAAGSGEGPDTTFATYPTSPSIDPCPNDQFRTGFGVRLPDCRAYEQATPADKHGANIQGSLNLIQAASGGNRISFFSNGGLPTSGGSSTFGPYMASRGATGWSSDGLLPATDPGLGAFALGWSEDLATSVTAAPGPGNAGKGLYLRDSDTAAFQLGLASSTEFNPFLAGFSADTSHLIFEANAVLAPGAVPGFEDNLYDLDHGTVTLTGRIPAGSATSCDDASGPACIPAPDGAFAGSYVLEESRTDLGGAVEHMYTQNTISRDGSRVFFTTRNSAQLYVREDATKTTRISASQRTIPDPNGEKPAAFMAATPNGSKVFFTSCEKLTDDSTAVSDGEYACSRFFADQGEDLYSYDVDTGELTDLTVDSNVSDPKGAAVRGVLGISDDGSYVYFAAGGALASGASPASCSVIGGNTCNLYVSHNGTTTFVASLSSQYDSSDWLAKPTSTAQRNSRVSADGRILLFSSAQSLTGYDNTATSKGACGSHSNSSFEPCNELFRYSVPANELICVSCNPAGVQPTDEAALGSIIEGELQGTGLRSTFLTRNLAADGDRAFFESPDALLPTDTNGVKDAYEWEAEGSGSCHTTGGCLYLLSSGTSPDPSHFADASASGDHAFIFTDQQLVPSDHDELIDIYDAGVGAGLASQHALAPPTCNGAACQSNPPPPPDQTPASAAFSGPGNTHERSTARKCPKGKRKVRSAGKVRCQKAHKQHKRHSNRGGSK